MLLIVQLTIAQYLVFKEIEMRVNKYNEVTLNQTRVHIPKSANYPRMILILTWDRYKVVTEDGEILVDDYRTYMNKCRPFLGISSLKNGSENPGCALFSICEIFTWQSQGLSNR